MLPSLIGPSPIRPSAERVARLRGVDVTRISDAVGRMYTMDGTVRPLAPPAHPVVGPAITVKCPPGDNLAMVRALTLVEPGDVLVVDAQGFSQWCLGGFLLLEHAARTRGLAGAIVNGAYRDVEEAARAGFPLYAKAIAPHSGPKERGGEINVPVCCGGVIVHPGDVVAASGEGIAVVPPRALAAVMAALEAKPGHDAGSIGAFVERLAGAFDATLD